MTQHGNRPALGPDFSHQATGEAMPSQLPEQQPPQGYEVPDPTQATLKMIEVAGFIADNNREIAGAPEGTPASRQHSVRKAREMLNTVAILTPIAERGLDPEEAIRQQLDQLATSEVSNEVQEQVRKLDNAFGFVREQSISPFNPDSAPKFKEWQRKQQAQAAHAAEQRHTAERQAEVQRSQEAAQDARQEILISHVLEQGGAAIHTDLPPAYSATNSRG